jgi:UDP-N-acetylglucosamine--N-acetylmuramyl-(pentapeptide) pyrophosphoryl-undecaprenol N-acetylglucosamine transferase
MRLLIAGGGTGGHLFPALAVARALREEDPESQILFVGTKHGIEVRVIPETEFSIKFIAARGMKRTGMINLLKGLLELPLGAMQSFSILWNFRPHVVLGVGGYASGPTLIAAALLRIPTAIQEQNSVMGTTNRVLSRIVNRIFVSWEQTVPPPPPEKTVLTGNPIRADLLEEVANNGSNRNRFNILIFGGSRGARSINQAMAGNLALLVPFADKITILHQSGLGAAEEMRQAYEEAGIQAEVKEFINEMGPAYKWADLVVCRSGASSLAEITALGKPAILIPYPYAIGDHQARNASVLENKGAVMIVPDDKLANGALVSEIRNLLEDPDQLITMGRNSLQLGRPDAARMIALDLLKMGRSRA